MASHQNDAESPGFIREILVAVLAAALVGAIYLAIEKIARPGIAVVSAFAASVIIVVLVMFQFTRKSAAKLAEQLRMIGIRKVHKNYHATPPINDVIAAATSSVDFLGISARTLFEPGHVEELVKKKLREGVAFRFLILGLDSPYLTSQARSEGDDPEAWKADISGTIARLKAIQKEIGSQQIAIKTYKSPPLWRALFMDRRTAYVNYYPKGLSGRDTPVMVIENDNASLFHPLHGYFNELWERADSQ